jgi:two-component system, OmpR family, sensor kinase
MKRPGARRLSLAMRITTLCLVVTGLAVIFAGLVTARLVRTAGETALRQSLAAQADVLASQLDQTGLGSRVGLVKVAGVLRGQGISVLLSRPETGLVTDLVGTTPAAEQAAMDAGLRQLGPNASVSTTRTVGGQNYLVEMRGVDAGIGGFALVQQLRDAAVGQRQLIRNILLALGGGLLLAVVAGVGLGSLLSRPLRRTAAVASSMREGRRDLRAPVEGPNEVAEVGAAVNELADALQHSEKRQQEFLLSVSHELRTPLTAVHGFAESLADGVCTGPEARRAGETIRRESARLERLVSDLLDLARLGADEFRLDLADVDLVSIVRGCAEVWRVRCARQNVSFRWETPPFPVLARVDPRRLRQVLDGLAENALRVTPSAAPMMLALSTSSAGEAVLQVRDGGPGLAPEDYPVAFERGVLNAKYRGRRPVGSGVGLALAHGLVTRMNGTIRADPAPEGGAAFTIVLPAVRAPAATAG